MNTHESFLVARAVGRVLRDSTRTEEIHLVEELTGRRVYQRILRDSQLRASCADLLRERPELRSDQLDFGQLRAMAPNTLGGAYARHLDDNGLSADAQATPTRFVDDDDVAYLMRRFRQTHDVWHALLGLGVQGHEEVILHAFSWGQLRLPVSAMVVVFGTLKHIVLEFRGRALTRALAEAWRSGRDAEPLLPVHWERMWDRPLTSVLDQYRVRPLDPGNVHG